MCKVVIFLNVETWKNRFPLLLTTSLQLLLHFKMIEVIFMVKSLLTERGNFKSLYLWNELSNWLPLGLILKSWHSSLKWHFLVACTWLHLGLSVSTLVSLLRIFLNFWLFRIIWGTKGYKMVLKGTFKYSRYLRYFRVFKSNLGYFF